MAGRLLPEKYIKRNSGIFGLVLTPRNQLVDEHQGPPCRHNFLSGNSEIIDGGGETEFQGARSPYSFLSTSDKHTARRSSKTGTHRDIKLGATGVYGEHRMLRRLLLQVSTFCPAEHDQPLKGLE